MLRLLPALLALALGGTWPATAVAAPPGGVGDEATERYKRGQEFAGREEWDAALAEFLASRRYRPSWQATAAAARCLEKLKRFDEALDLFESLLRDFSAQLTPQFREQAQARVQEQRRLVGLVEIDGAEPGAEIAVDGRSRGAYPLAAPLRVAVGSHVVRVFKEGFDPFEARIEVAGGKLERVEARLRPLGRSGRLHVAEQRGRPLEVVIDGSVVGKAPWDGLLAPGDHVIALRGEGHVGTPPVRVVVEESRTVPLTLAAEELTAALRVEPVPVNASVAIDGVTVGRGVWDGRLLAGAHQIEIAAPGFLPESRRLTIAPEQREALRVTLERDESSPFWRKPPRRSRFVVEASTSLVLVPTLGGGVAGACVDPCQTGIGSGGLAALHAGYELGLGLGFGVAVGYLSATENVTGRPTPVGLVHLPAATAKVNDRLTLRGGLAGAWLGYTLGERAPVHLRLGGGVLAGGFHDERSGAFSGTRYPIGPLFETHRADYVYVAPAVRVALPLGAHVSLDAGLEALALIAVSQPTWDAKHPIDAGTSGYGTFNADVLSSRVVVVLAPGIGARYDF